MLVSSVGLAQDGDRDCPDFATQQEAQEYFESRGPGDPDRLDRDDDGVACEDPAAEGGDGLPSSDPGEDGATVDEAQYGDEGQPELQTP